MKKEKYYCIDCGKILTGHGKPKRCGSCARLSKNLSEETRQKMKDNHVGMTGKTMSEETKQIHRERMMGNTFSYKNGLTFRVGEQFLKSVNYICGCCGFQELPKNKTGKNKKINAHHIIERKEAPYRINDFSNLFCLCAKCHRLYHNRNRGNINLNSLKEFIKGNL